MAQLPVYRKQGNITTETPGAIRNLDAFSQGSQGMQKAGNALMQLAAQWQESKDAVENLNGKNKLNSDISAILDEAANYNDYSTPDELQQKQDELTQRMNNIVPDVVGGFSNNMNAREFEAQGQFAVQQNIYKLQEIFRNKYGDMYEADRMAIQDRCFENYAKTGNEGFKQEYFNAIDTGRKAGYLTEAQAQKLKLQTDEWNYSYAYSQILDNPYAKITDETLSKIDPVKQRTLRNFQRAEIKRAQAEAEVSAMNDYAKNPTQANLNRLYKANPKLRGSKQIEGLKNFQPDYEAVTNFEGMSDALKEVKNLASIDVSTTKGKQKYAQKAMEVATALNKMQVKKKGVEGGVISEGDRRKLFNMIYDDMVNDNFKNQLKNMPDLSREWSNEFTRDYQKVNGDAIKAEYELQKLKASGVDKNSKEYKDAEAKYQKAWRARHYYMGYKDVANQNRAANAPRGVQDKIKEKQQLAAKEMLAAYQAGNIKEANRIKEQYGEQMVRLKYWNIPALQKQNLKAGDKFTVNGKVYSFQGFSKNDVIVEVN